MNENDIILYDDYFYDQEFDEDISVDNEEAQTKQRNFYIN